MKTFEDYVVLVNEKKMLLKDACKELGISRQTWYNRLKPKPVREPKQKPVKESRPVGRPRKRLVGYPVVDWAAVEAAEKAEQNEWLKNLSEANEVMTAFLNKTFPRTWCKLRFEHVDAAAYWYTFELVNDDRRQTWCVRHSDLKFDEMMREFAGARGEKFLEENERLKDDPVPEEVRQRALELIERSFDE